MRNGRVILKIPKIIHQIWLGPNEIPERLLSYRTVWKELHPDWEFWCWRDKDVPELVNQKLYDYVDTYSGRSDVLRYEIIYKHGGVYVDMDYMPFKNIEPVIKDLDFFINADVVENWHEKCPNYFNASLYGAVPKHPLSEKLITNLPQWVMSQDHWADPCKQTGPLYTSYLFRNEDIVVLPPKTFNGEYAKHYFLGSWGKEWGFVK
jgi:mannosyltransferase OCH1-like enzyme